MGTLTKSRYTQGWSRNLRYVDCNLRPSGHFSSFAIADDLRRLSPPNGRLIRSVIDLSDLARINDYVPWCLDDGQTTGLAALLAHYLHRFLPLKDTTTNDFKNTVWPIPLSDDHILCNVLSS